MAGTLNGVENEFSGIAYDPERSGADGRLYPPDEQYRDPKWESPGLRCYRQRAHMTIIAANGAIEIRERNVGELGAIILGNAGNDGRKVSNYDAFA